MAKLLLVEDDNNLREIYEARLQAEGYTIVSAKDGEEALVVAKAEKPDLVISDVMMPKISGFEMLDILRNTDELKHVKVIMLTALGQSDDQQRADKLGADRYLVKSQVTLEDIVKVTHELLEGEAAPAPAGTTDAPAPAAAPTPDAPAPVADDTSKTDDAAKPADAPAPAPEPVAEPPAAEPVKAEPVVEPPKEEPKEEPKATADDAVSKDAAKPAAEEEADVEAKIEDFVAGATSEPTAPATPAPAADDAAKSTAKTTDDKLMADAVEKLVASTDKKEEGTAAPAGDAAPSAPAAPAGPKVIPVSVASDDDKPATSAGSQKIIKPLEDSAPKKDINQLLAEEEGKQEDAEDRPAGQPATTAPGAVTTPGAKKDASSGVDPNSIAL